MRSERSHKLHPVYPGDQGLELGILTAPLREPSRCIQVLSIFLVNLLATGP